MSKSADTVAERAERTEGNALASGGVVGVAAGKIVAWAERMKKLSMILMYIILTGL